MSSQTSVKRRRKFSFPATIHHNPLGLPERVPHIVAKRRFSNVSGVVSRKLSSTIGWRTATVPIADIVTQGKTLCGQYIRCRLKRANMFNRKCGLQRLCSVSNLTGGYVVREVFPELLHVGVELERLHPGLYTGVGRQACSTPVLATEAVTAVVIGVARDLAISGLTWAKVVSLFAVSGGLALDCVRQGHPELVQPLVAAMGDALDFHIADWIAHNGGWPGLLSYCKPETHDVSLAGFIGLLTALLVAVVSLLLLVQWFGKIYFT